MSGVFSDEFILERIDGETGNLEGVEARCMSFDVALAAYEAACAAYPSDTVVYRHRARIIKIRQ